MEDLQPGLRECPVCRLWRLDPNKGQTTVEEVYEQYTTEVGAKVKYKTAHHPKCPMGKGNK